MYNQRLIARWIGMLFFLGFFFPSQSQTDKELLAQLAAEDHAAINALMLYPKETRVAILESTLYPEALIKLENIQSQTSTSFKKILESHTKASQEMIWDLTRYPDLINRLVMAGKDSKTGVNKVLNDYPAVIHQRAKQAAINHYQVLVEIDELDQSAQSAFTFLLANYPDKTQGALQEMIALPEVLTILTENIRLTILVGDLYRKEPEWVLHKADSMNLEIARKNAAELEDWKESLENNPQAMEELETTAESFKLEHGYEDEYYSYEWDDLYYDADKDDLEEDYYSESDDQKVIVHAHYDYHYPYWFGYPYWYEYPRWRLYSSWYDWGFYFSPHHTVVVIGLPSFYFTHWYFYHPYHHYYWPHLSAHFSNHYYGHRNVGSSITTSVREWKNQNREVVTEDWLRNDERLPERFQEYGKFETSRIKYNREHPRKAVSQKEYVERYERRYPGLAKSAEKINYGEANKEDFNNKSPNNPPISKPKTRESYEPKTKQPNIPLNNKTSPKKRITVPNVNKGKEYHRNSWEQTKSKPRVIKPRVPKIKPSPRTKMKVPKTNTPKTRTKTPRTKKKN